MGLIVQALAKARRPIRWLTAVVILLVVLLGGGAFGVYWLLPPGGAYEQALRTAGTRLARKRAPAPRISGGPGRGGPGGTSGPACEPARAAEARTHQLQAALDRPSTPWRTLAVGESRREEAQRDLQRMREQLAAAEGRAPSQGLLDSLRRAVATAERRPPRSMPNCEPFAATDFAGLAQQNQGAVGLITVALDGATTTGPGSSSVRTATC